MFLFLFLTLFCSAETYKIAIFVPGVSSSQIIFNQRIGDILSEAGHNVTFIHLEMFEFKKNTVITAKPGSEVWNINVKSNQIDYWRLWELNAEIAFSDESPWESIMNPNRRAFFTGVSDNLKQACEQLVKNQAFLDRLKAANFDVVLSHMADFCPVGLQYHIKAPTWAWVSSGPLLDHMAYLSGLYLPASYAAPILADMSDKLSFVQRIKSVIGHTITPFMVQKMSADNETAIFRQYIDSEFPDLFDIAKTAPLIFINTNDLYDLPRPTLHKIINIGGIEKPSTVSKPLPSEYLAKIEKAKNVVVFTFGSIANATLMPESWKTAFARAFEKFEDTQFFIRYDGDNWKVPKNVHLSKWLPQCDLLQHPKTRAFITHGGYNGLQEALIAGKPLLAIPLFGDQFKNANIIEKHGLGIALKKSEISEKRVTEALDALLHDEKYPAASKRMKRMVEKQPVKPEELPVRWIEFLAEFKTLDNLRPMGASLNFVTYYNIDVYGLFVEALGIVMFIVYKIFKFVVSKIYGLFRSRKVKVQ